MKAKDLHRAKIVEFLADPENPFLTWSMLGQSVLGHKNPKSIYHLFNSQEREEIATDALTIRRRRYTFLLGAVDKALFHKAMTEGDPSAAKLIYQKFEGWTEKREQKHVVSIEETLSRIREKRTASAD